MKERKVAPQDANQRLDKYLLKYFNAAPKGFVYKMLRKKRIKYNGKRAEGNELLQPGDTIQFYLAEDTMAGFMEEKPLAAAERHFGIVFENDRLLVVDKPAGLLSHPEKAGDTQTLIDQILYYLAQKGQYAPDKENTFTPALCNRLDRNTSGLVMAGKDFAAVQAVNLALKERKLDKYYLALVKGRIQEPGEAKAYHQKDPGSNRAAIFDAYREGAKAVALSWVPVAQYTGFTLLEIKLLTGRTHQIRAQLSSMGHPVVGDRKYGDERINRLFRQEYALSRQFLHAYRLVWHNPDWEITCPLPPELERIRTGLQGGTHV